MHKSNFEEQGQRRERYEEAEKLKQRKGRSKKEEEKNGEKDGTQRSRPSEEKRQKSWRSEEEEIQIKGKSDEEEVEEEVEEEEEEEERQKSEGSQDEDFEEEEERQKHGKSEEEEEKRQNSGYEEDDKGRQCCGKSEKEETEIWKKQREIEFADITDSTAIDNNSVQYWIKSLLLFEEDRKCLESGDWLSDAHIFAALKLLKKQYPHQNGLQSTLLLANKLEWKSSNEDFVQILHIGGNHWVCVSNINCPPNSCNIYDTTSP